MTEKIEVNLGSVQKTLLLPLWGRAVETRKGTPLLIDKTAAEIIDRIDYNFSKIAKNIVLTTQLAWIARSLHIDRTIRRFLENHPDATIVNIGCGLDTTFERVNNGRLLWFDLDLPDVIELWKNFVPELERRKYIACSFLDDKWLCELKGRASVLFIAAGVFYYFEEKEIKDFLTKLAGIFPGGEMIFDVASPLGVKTANKRVIEAGGMDKTSVLKWGIRKAADIHSWDKRISVVEEYPIFKGIKRHLSLKGKIGTSLSDTLKIMSMVHLAFSR